jgi:hypothetical protein
MSNYQYQGCFNDTGNRAIPNYTGQVNSPQQCATIAQQNNSNVYGVQDGGQCFIGNNIQQAMEYGQNYGNCGYLGSAWTNQVYYTPPNTMCGYQMNNNELQCYKNNYPDLSNLNNQQLQQHWSSIGCNQQRNNQCPNYQTISGNYIYNGCFNDTGNRAIPNYRGNVNTVDECRQIAEQNRETVFGVQYYGQCFTGTNEQQAKEYGQNFNGNACPYLGSSWTNQVYVRGQPFPPPLPPLPKLTQQNFNN